MEDVQTPPQTEVDPSIFNFHNGDLGKLKRIVARHKLKDRIKLLETVIRTHQPLVNAMKVTQKAYQEGVQVGFRKAVDEIAKADAEKAAQTQAPETSSLVPEVQPVTQSEATVPTSEGGTVEPLPSASPELKAQLEGMHL